MDSGKRPLFGCRPRNKSGCSNRASSRIKSGAAVLSCRCGGTAADRRFLGMELGKTSIVQAIRTYDTAETCGDWEASIHDRAIDGARPTHLGEGGRFH